MNLLDWLKPGLKIKRWIFLCFMGFMLIVIGILPVAYKVFYKNTSFDTCMSILFLGFIFIGFALKKGVGSLLNLMDLSGMSTQNKIEKKMYEKRILNKGPKVVVIGGGTGLSVLLRGLKNFTSNITAIVTVADDGGGSGILREDLGMLPPGDIRNCILALANTEPIMENLLQYRFEEGQLKGQSFGNLLIAAMNGISGNFEEAIKKINDVLAVTGKVLPVTLEDITLYAKLKNGKIIKGESKIPKKVKEFKSRIEKVFIKPRGVKPLDDAVEEIYNADVIILGPGSLYTSIIPNLLVEDIAKAIRESSASKVYVTNVMTQPGETDEYGVWDHVKEIINYLNGPVIDYVFVNNEKIPVETLKKYASDGAVPIRLTKKDKEILYKNHIRVVEGPFVDIKKQYIRHDANKLSEMITKLVKQNFSSIESV
ncbi:YvcK family protein [Crassaminicella thermophila]|uniref:Putative gluconeogenesis factor n=1 Tax=Crassaminicella thermophila TaxID=2599308 RepID=A0A5C0SE68_CRATE|nr:YvcK family protein [Crassaminicella thermophila]QEK11584.1 YvcK family protein [Crassaminicella thermophila]